MVAISFALVREGTSDNGLVPHIRTLLLAAGADSVVGLPRDYKGTVESRVRQVLAEPDPVDIIFVHRDADASDPEPRFSEVSAAAHRSACQLPVIAIVPIHELEAWLLVDEDQIRSAVGRPRGRAALDLPSIARIEQTSRPKEVLKAACLAASETSGARKQKEAARFPLRRATLLDRLDPNGPVNQLPSWRRLVGDIGTAMHLILSDRE